MNRKCATLIFVAATVGLPLHAATVFKGHDSSLRTAHVFHTGETLASLAEMRYGHRSYELVIAKLNKIADPKAVKDGTEIRLPELDEMLLNEGLPKELKSDLKKWRKARYVLVRYQEVISRALQPGNSQAVTKVLPANVRTDLQQAATTLNEVGKNLAKAGKFAESPVRVRQRLDACAATLKQLADGASDPGLMDQAHLLMAQAYVRAIMWARGEATD